MSSRGTTTRSNKERARVLLERENFRATASQHVRRMRLPDKVVKSLVKNLVTRYAKQAAKQGKARHDDARPLTTP